MRGRHDEPDHGNDQGKAHELVDTPSHLLGRLPGPVSYTHLDVYKRQVQDGGHLGEAVAVAAVFDQAADFLLVHLVVDELSLIHI